MQNIWSAIKQIIIFVAGTFQYGCKYVKGAEIDLLGFSDSDHDGDLEKRKSTTSVVFFLGKNRIYSSSHDSLSGSVAEQTYRGSVGH
jgi:heterodisulfide reductase subunit B